MFAHARMAHKQIPSLRCGMTKRRDAKLQTCLNLLNRFSEAKVEREAYDEVGRHDSDDT